MPLAVRFDEYGGVDVLNVVEVARPVPGPGEVLVKVEAAAVNPGEAVIRTGLAHAMFPATFPSGQGSDLAGVVAEVGPPGPVATPEWLVGDEVIGFTDRRASHAEYVVVDAANLVSKPAGVPWEVAGSLYVAGTTAYAAVRAVAPTADDTLVVAAATGGVGSIAVQLARLTGATVIGLASATHHCWLKGYGVIGVEYGPGVAERIQVASGGRVDAFIDAFGHGYVDLALKLGVPAQRINTIVDFAAVEKHGVKFEGNAAAANAAVLAELAALIDAGRLEVPIAAVYPLAKVRDAYREVELRHTHGKIVLRP